MENAVFMRYKISCKIPKPLILEALHVQMYNVVHNNLIQIVISYLKYLQILPTLLPFLVIAR